MFIELQIKKKKKPKSEFYFYVSHLFLSDLKGKNSQECSGIKQSANLYLLCENAN